MIIIRFFSIFLTLTLTSQALAGENDLYDFLWLDPDKSVYVLQNKIYEKENSIYLDIGYIDSLSSTFQDTSGAQLKLGYYLTEEWAVEVDYIQYSNSDNTAFDSVKIINGSVPFIRKPITSTSVFAIWSPFYGKINTFNKIFYFDWSMGIGSGKYLIQSNLDSVLDPSRANVFDTKEVTPVQLKTNIKFHINKSLHFGIEYLNTNYQDGNPKSPSKKSWTRNNDLIFSIGVSF